MTAEPGTTEPTRAWVAPACGALVLLLLGAGWLSFNAVFPVYAHSCGHRKGLKDFNVGGGHGHLCGQHQLSHVFRLLELQEQGYSEERGTYADPAQLLSEGEPSEDQLAASPHLLREVWREPYPDAPEGVWALHYYRHSRPLFLAQARLGENGWELLVWPIDYVRGRYDAAFLMTPAGTRRTDEPFEGLQRRPDFAAAAAWPLVSPSRR